MYISKSELEAMVRTYLADLELDDSYESKTELDALKGMSRVLLAWAREFFPASAPERIRIALLHAATTLTQQMQETVAQAQARVVDAEREISIQVDTIKRLQEEVNVLKTLTKAKADAPPVENKENQ